MYPVILLFYCKKNKKTKLFKKKKQNRRQGLWRKKRKKKTKKQRRRKGLRPPVSQSNLFPLHLHWLKRQSVTSFYPFFVCFHFLVRCWHGVFRQFRRYGRYGPSQRESAWIGPSLSRIGASQCELWQRKKKKTQMAGCSTNARAAASLACWAASDTGAAPLALHPCFPGINRPSGVCNNQSKML